MVLDVIKFSKSYWYHLNVGQGTYVCSYLQWSALLLSKLSSYKKYRKNKEYLNFLKFNLEDRNSRVYAREVDRHLGINK